MARWLFRQPNDFLWESALVESFFRLRFENSKLLLATALDMLDCHAFPSSVRQPRMLRCASPVCQCHKKRLPVHYAEFWYAIPLKTHFSHVLDTASLEFHGNLDLYRSNSCIRKFDSSSVVAVITSKKMDLIIDESGNMGRLGRLN